jgi:transcriptional regulator with XRE-family HTH domain
MKQSELAVFLNVTQGTLSNWERGVHDPDNDMLLLLSKKFNVSIDYLLGKSSETGTIYNAQNITGNFVQGNGIMNDGEHQSVTSVDEVELVRIYRLLDAKQRHRLMSFAFDMEENILRGGNPQ